MSEWQPARLIDPHNRRGKTPSKCAVVFDSDKQKAILKRVVRVKEVIPRDVAYWSRRCGTTRIYRVHEDDCGAYDAHVCEHEILTD